MSKITFALESLCLLNNPRALNAYHFIDQLAKTGHEIKIVTTYEEKAEFEFKSKNISIYRPLKGLKFLETLNAYPLLFNEHIDIFHIFAPFTQKKWSQMRNLKVLALVLKTIKNCKTSFSGYDPSFHSWPQKVVKSFNEGFDLIFSHFYDQIPSSHNQPLVVPLEDNSPTFDDESKVISVLANFSQVLDEPEILKTLEDFLEKYPEWRVQICGGWGPLGLLNKSSQQVYWQDKNQLHQWLVAELNPMASSSLVIDLSTTLSDGLYFAQQCLHKRTPYITKTPILKQVKDRDFYSATLIWVINNFEGALFEKLLLVAEYPLPEIEALRFEKSDVATNVFNRAFNNHL